ncbi:Transposase IS4 [Popillia japonica]|uniref:Transposase IS4 n=1 Tax=Popillia japonica TaxID=7064 RepID=A0AAW1N4M1_POPJA
MATLPTDKLFKVRNLIEQLVGRFKSVYEPDEVMVVDETMIPFRGRLKLRQYIPGKRQNYSVKIFKLCCSRRYTYNLQAYEGTTEKRVMSIGSTVVMDLCKDYLGQGRNIITDNFYTSLELSYKLLENKTHSLGTLRANRKGFPKEIVKQKLKPGEVIGRENADGIVVMKWSAMKTFQQDAKIEKMRRFINHDSLFWIITQKNLELIYQTNFPGIQHLSENLLGDTTK